MEEGLRSIYRRKVKLERGLGKVRGGDLKKDAFYNLPKINYNI
jgi:hypothetical protein